MRAPRLPVYDPQSKRDMAGEARRRREHSAALESCVGRITRWVSEALGTVHYSMRTLEEQARGDARPAGEVVEIQVQASRDRGKDEGEAAAPLFTLARRLGYSVAPLAVPIAARPDVVGRAADASQEFTEALSAALELARSSFTSPTAVGRARKEIPEAIDALWKLARDVDELYARQQQAAAEVAL